MLKVARLVFLLTKRRDRMQEIQYRIGSNYPKETEINKALKEEER